MTDCSKALLFYFVTALLFGIIQMVESLTYNEFEDDRLLQQSLNESNSTVNSDFSDYSFDEEDLENFYEYSLTSARQSQSQGKGKKKKNDLLSRILPMMVIPYLIQSAFLPVILMSLKAMLFNSFIVGKLAIFLGLVNAFRRGSSTNEEIYEGGGGHMMKNIMKSHYGYGGSEEFGAYIHH